MLPVYAVYHHRCTQSRPLCRRLLAAVRTLVGVSARPGLHSALVVPATRLVLTLESSYCLSSVVLGLLRPDCTHRLNALVTAGQQQMQDHNTHRELIAAVASLKSCTRSVILSLSAPKPDSPRPAGSRIAGSLQRANDATANLRRLLSAASDQTLTLPLSTARRLVEVEVPELLEQLLASCLPYAVWPLPESSDPGAHAADSSNASDGAARTAAAIQHPSWQDVQQLIANVFHVLMLLCGVAVRAYTRSSDPLMVLLQLSSPKVMKACVAYMEQLWDAHTRALVGAGADSDSVASAGQAADNTAATAASNSFACAVSAFSSCYSLLAAALDAQSGLQELEMQLVNSLCSTRFLPLAVRLLMSATCPPGQQHAFEVDCQQAGWDLLTLALFLSGGDIAISPAGPSSVEVRPGQHIPSSVLAAYMRQQGEAATGGIAATKAAMSARSEGAATATLADTEAATGLPLTTMQQQLLGPQVLQFLEERFYHAVREMPGSRSSSGGGVAPAPASAQLGDPAAEPQLLLPGRCVPDDQDVMAAALRSLRCWRALLVGPAGPTLPLATPRGLQLLLSVLNSALAESIKDSSSERQALRGRLVRVAVHCLQLLCGCVEQNVLVGQLTGLTAVLSKVVGAAAAYWEANKRAIKSADLPFTGQVRCVDKATGDMMVRYNMAAQSALSVLQQLVKACSAQQTSLLTRDISGCDAIIVMLSAGLLPPIEQLFRQVPGVSPAHVAAADLLVQVFPLCGSADITFGQLPLLATLRKFLVKAVGLPEPDRTAANAVAVKLADMLGRLGSSCNSDGRLTSDQGWVLLQHAATHLLPAFQVYCSSAVKGPVPAHCSSAQGSTMIVLSDLNTSTSANVSASHLYPSVLSMYQELAKAARGKPELGLQDLLLGNQAMAVSASLIGSNYWVSPQVAAAVAQSGNGHLTSQHAAELVTSLLEDLLYHTAEQTETPVNTARADPADVPAAQLHMSSSDDCLCAIKRHEASLCAVGNPLCGVDGPCDCASPKANSETAGTTDAAPPQSVPMTKAAGSSSISGCVTSPRSQSLAEQQQRMLQRQLLLSGLMQSRLLPELQRLLQQLPAGPGNPALGALFGGSLSAAPSRNASQGGSLAMAVPRRTVSGSMQSKDSSRVGGHSPTYSILNARNRNTNSGPLAHVAGSRFAAGKRSSTEGAGIADFKALAGTSPPIEGDVGGLLRAANSWSSLMAAEVRLSSSSRQNSAVLGSSPNLTSLAAQHSNEPLAQQDSYVSVGTAGQSDPSSPVAAGQSSLGASSALQQLQLRLEAVLVAAGQAVLDLCDSGLLADGVGRLSGTSTISSPTHSWEISSKRGSWAGGAPVTSVTVGTAPAAPGLNSRPSFSGSISSFNSLPVQEDVFAALRLNLAAARPSGTVALTNVAAEAVGPQGDSPRAMQGVNSSKPAVCMYGNSNEMLFPVDLGLAQLHISDLGRQGSTPTSRVSLSGLSNDGISPSASQVSPRPGAAPDSNTEPGVLSDTLRGLVASLQATGPALSRSCGTALDAEFSGHTLMARLDPKLVGCWNPGCVNMAGVSEAVAPAKPCGNCKVAVFCSKACEKMAWSSHTMACGKLAAQANECRA